MSFPHKDCVLEFDSTDEKTSANSEVMLNEIIAKEDIDVLLDEKVFTHAKKIDGAGEKPISVFEDTDGLLIKGNNLLVLYSLIPRYENKIKLMYWDVLYNTDNDQIPYNDSFKHDIWLVMMKDRLEVAKTLLTNNGVICIQCDKNEDAYLKVLCDEIFGRNNYITTIAVRTSTPSGNKTSWKDRTIIKTKDSILIYAKNTPIKVNPQYIAKAKWDTHYGSFMVKDENGTLQVVPLKEKLIEENIIRPKETITEKHIDNPDFKTYCLEHASQIFRMAPSMPKDIKKHSKEHPSEVIPYTDTNGNQQFAYNGNRMVFLNNAVKDINGTEEMAELLCDIWTDIDFQNTQNEGGAASLPSGKKPEALLRRIISLFTEPGDIVLDAYLGSGTTAAVAHKMGRKYIGIEQLDKHIAMAIQRVTDVIHGEESGISKIVDWKGGGSFITFDLASNSEKMTNRIKNAESSGELDLLLEKLKDSPFVLARVDIEKLGDDDWDQLSFEEQKELLLSVVDLNTLYVNLTEIDDETYGITEDDKSFTKSFYNVQED